MSTTPGPAESRDAIDVAVIGAGPTGLMIANLLGPHGLRVSVFEAGPALVDFPRGVGMDDETLRTFQAAGLVEAVLPHTVPHQLLAFVDHKQRDLARIAPPAATFGWPRRNGFVQPLADRVLLEGLGRFGSVDVRWSSRVEGLTQDGGGVDLAIVTPDGGRTVRASYVVGADGGRSTTRKSLGYDFVGDTASADWFVIDIRNDPLGRPGAYVCADPRRPYVSISIPHGIRRFEFMLKPGETEADAMTDAFLRRLLEPVLPPSAPVDIIRRRVYTHHSRMAERFRSGRVLLIGDAAHVMPVWQGQGYNSGIRDSLNLSWKLAMVVRGQASDTLLDSYESERREHVLAMIQLSTWVGRLVSVRNRVGAAGRNAFFRALSAVPRAKRYIVQMRFKPMPAMTKGALTRVGSVGEPSPVGRLFIQSTVSTRGAPSLKLDDALGPWFALIAWNNDPTAILDEDARRRLARLGARLVAARPAVQLGWDEPSPNHRAAPADGAGLGGGAVPRDSAVARDNAVPRCGAVSRDNAVPRDTALARDGVVPRHDAVPRDNAVLRDDAVPGHDAVPRDNAVLRDDAVPGHDAVPRDNAVLRDDAVPGHDAVPRDNAVPGHDAVPRDNAEPRDEVLVIGDVDGALKAWFDAHPESVILVRPDRIIGGASPAYAASDMVRGFDLAIGAPDLAPDVAPSENVTLAHRD